MMQIDKQKILDYAEKTGRSICEINKSLGLGKCTLYNIIHGRIKNNQKYVICKIIDEIGEDAILEDSLTAEEKEQRKRLSIKEILELKDSKKKKPKDLICKKVNIKKVVHTKLSLISQELDKNGIKHTLSMSTKVFKIYGKKRIDYHHEIGLIKDISSGKSKLGSLKDLIKYYKEG